MVHILEFRFIIPVLSLIADRILKYLYPIYRNYEGPFSLGFSGIYFNILNAALLAVFLYLLLHFIKGTSLKHIVYCNFQILAKIASKFFSLIAIKPQNLFSNFILKSKNFATTQCFKEVPKEKNLAKILGALFIVLGGASNLFDRLAYGYVIDYINFFGISFFNLSDVIIFLGAIILLFGKNK